MYLDEDDNDEGTVEDYMQYLDDDDDLFDERNYEYDDADDEDMEDDISCRKYQYQEG